MTQASNHGLVLLAVITFWLLPGMETSLPAIEFRTDERLMIETDETIEDDLYVFGDEVTINGEVQGDVVAFARLLKMNGRVEGDLIAAAQAIVISGTVTDDARIAGQALKIDKGAAIGDDVIGAAFSMEAVATSAIGGDLVYAGYQAKLAGDIAGKTRAGIANCEISGHLGGDVDLGIGVDPAGSHAYTGGSPPPISIPSVPPGLTIRDVATLDGNLTFESPQEAEIVDGAHRSVETSSMCVRK